MAIGQSRSGWHSDPVPDADNVILDKEDSGGPPPPHWSYLMWAKKNQPGWPFAPPPSDGFLLGQRQQLPPAGDSNWSVYNYMAGLLQYRFVAIAFFY